MKREHSNISLLLGLLASIGLSLAVGLYFMFNWPTGLNDIGTLLWSFGFVFLMFGVICIISGIFTSLFYQNREWGCTVPVVAVLTSVRKDKGNPRSGIPTRYVPTYTYQLNGNPVRVEVGASLYQEDFQPGEKMELLINPENPRKFKQVKDTTGIPKLKKALLFIGIALFVVGAGMLIAILFV